MSVRRPVPPAAFLLPALLLLGAAGAWTQPKLAIEGGKAFDFGRLLTAVPVSRELRIRNAGTDTLRIKDVSGSCGCTGTLLSRSDIPPGGDGTLRITFDPAKFKGKVDKVVSMKTNDPADPNPHITFTATIVPVLEFEFSHVVVNTAVDSEATTVVAVRNLSEAPVRITSVAASPAGLNVAVVPERLAPGESGELRCSARPSKAGILKGDIVLTTDHPDLPSMTLRYFVYAKSSPAAAGAPSGK